MSRPRSRMTTRALGSRRRAWLAALIPAATPPMTTISISFLRVVEVLAEGLLEPRRAVERDAEAGGAPVRRPRRRAVAPPGSPAVAFPMRGEELLVGGRRRRVGDHPRDPGQVDEVARVDVFGGDVAAPGAAGERQGERQAVARAARALVEVLVHQHAPGAGAEGQRVDVGVFAGVDAAGVAEPLVGGDGVELPDCILDDAEVAG